MPANSGSAPLVPDSAEQGKAVTYITSEGIGKKVVYLDEFKNRISANSMAQIEITAISGAAEIATIAALPQGDAMSDLTREEMREAIAASEARGDTKIARFEGKLDLVLSKLDDVRQDNRTTRANQWVIGLGLAALIVTIVSIFPVFFDWGSKIRDLVDKEVHSTQTTKSVELPRNENEISGGKKGSGKTAQ